jgi:hypothetical protein
MTEEVKTLKNRKKPTSKTKFDSLTCEWNNRVLGSVPDPNPWDPYVFGPLGCGSFRKQAKKIKKNWLSTVL